MNTLSEAQQRILAFIHDYVETHGVPPTIREIQHGVGLSSTSMVSYHLRALERAQRLSRYARRSRGVVLREVHPSSEIVNVPLVGQIVASAPAPTPDADALAAAEHVIPIARNLVSTTKGLYALEVRGDSMIDALIHDGDIVILRRVESADEVKNGDLVAVFLTDRNESTLKRIYREGRRLKLKPENPTLQPFYVDAQHARILGRVECVIRRVS
ncbi:MAG: transcriptional repressor LexA [Thermoflexales bacterium]|nr:transcriptional repressor LexA [Thermoflexales bacterium]MCS7325030.1 transcriptional repressor LexA [Thermoflexales bacterium]MCX7939603.1 transcriptional repressor LexA [Thermoflexales bacterium]MDW8054185.1 transcriptional repressor LexA [Anaerolineae bacterium]MDW8292295.1 transcriptional repressor LexA [Anaerolineae bacterium]